ncbi:MAG TPA: YihY family inner membrane protein [Gammaproteobacteria bacterium]|nr:YihY family inner membrane protein [Gammaproteobacteria bacterium]
MDPASLRRFLRFLFHHFNADHGLRTAASLSYTTLLSLVPLLVVMFSVLSAFPVFDTAVARIQDYIFRNFVPASGEVVQAYVQQFLHQASSLTGPGVAFLMLAAVMLMDTIDGVLNDIWGVQRRRRWLSQFLVYWAVLTLGPLLLAVSLIVSSYLISLPLVKGVDPSGSLRGMLLSLMPFLSTTVALTLLYVLVPNRVVPLRHGVAGAALAALFFELAKRSFTLYVANVPTYSTLYGALAVIPLFLVWMYLSWVMVLLGAEITYCLTLFRREAPVPGEEQTGERLFLYAFRILGHLWKAQRAGEGRTLEELARLEAEAGQEGLEEVLKRLEARRIVAAGEEGTWLLARDPGAITLLDIYNAMPHALPRVEGAWWAADPWNRRLAEVLGKAVRDVSRALDEPLSRLYGGDADQQDGDAGDEEA